MQGSGARGGTPQPKRRQPFAGPTDANRAKLNSLDRLSGVGLAERDVLGDGRRVEEAYTPSSSPWDRATADRQARPAYPVPAHVLADSVSAGQAVHVRRGGAGFEALDPSPAHPANAQVLRSAKRDECTEAQLFIRGGARRYRPDELHASGVGIEDVYDATDARARELGLYHRTTHDDEVIEEEAFRWERRRSRQGGPTFQKLMARRLDAPGPGMGAMSRPLRREPEGTVFDHAALERDPALMQRCAELGINPLGKSCGEIADIIVCGCGRKAVVSPDETLTEAGLESEAWLSWTPAHRAYAVAFSVCERHPIGRQRLAPPGRAVPFLIAAHLTLWNARPWVMDHDPGDTGLCSIPDASDEWKALTRAFMRARGVAFWPWHADGYAAGTEYARQVALVDHMGDVFRRACSPDRTDLGGLWCLRPIPILGEPPRGVHRDNVVSVPTKATECARLIGMSGQAYSRLLESVRAKMDECRIPELPPTPETGEAFTPIGTAVPDS